jgi:hypothetical protein
MNHKNLAAAHGQPALAEHKVACAVVSAVDELVVLFQKWSEQTAEADRGCYEGFKICWQVHSTALLKFSRVHMALADTGSEISDLEAKKMSVNWETSDESEQELQSIYTGAMRLLDPRHPLTRRAGGLFLVTCLFFSLPQKLVRKGPGQEHNIRMYVCMHCMCIHAHACSARLLCVQRNTLRQTSDARRKDAHVWLS